MQSAMLSIWLQLWLEMIQTHKDIRRRFCLPKKADASSFCSHRQNFARLWGKVKVWHEWPTVNWFLLQNFFEDLSFFSFSSPPKLSALNWPLSGWSNVANQKSDVNRQNGLQKTYFLCWCPLQGLTFSEWICNWSRPDESNGEWHFWLARSSGVF